MAANVDLYGLLARVRKLVLPAYSDGDEKIPGMNSRGELMFNQALPERAEVVRMGNSFSAQMPAASAWTLLITIPTTLANLSLQNGEPSGGKSYLIDRFWVKNVTSEASAGELCPLSQLVPAGTAQVANDATVLRVGLSGAPNATGRTNSKLVMASTATGCLQDKWNHHASRGQSETTNIATCVEVLCYGRYIVPPGASFNVNAQESVSGGTAICGIEWHEVQIDVA
jgi:hypothetical protein